MLIDVLISNSARPDALPLVLGELSKKFVGGEHAFRFVLFEYRVGKQNRIQQQSSYTWLRKHRKLFDEIVLVNRDIENDLWFKDLVDKSKADYFMHIEGECPLISDILLDVVVDIMMSNDDITQIVFNNGEITKEHIVGTEEVDGLKFGELNFFSRSSGVFNTELVRNMFNFIKEKDLSFNHVDLAKAAKELGYKNYVLADRKQHIDF